MLWTKLLSVLMIAQLQIQLCPISGCLGLSSLLFSEAVHGRSASSVFSTTVPNLNVPLCTSQFTCCITPKPRLLAMGQSCGDVGPNLCPEADDPSFGAPLPENLSASTLLLICPLMNAFYLHVSFHFKMLVVLDPVTHVRSAVGHSWG